MAIHGHAAALCSIGAGFRSDSDAICVNAKRGRSCERTGHCLRLDACFRYRIGRQRIGNCRRMCRVTLGRSWSVRATLCVAGFLFITTVHGLMMTRIAPSGAGASINPAFILEHFGSFFLHSLYEGTRSFWMINKAPDYFQIKTTTPTDTRCCHHLSWVFVGLSCAIRAPKPSLSKKSLHSHFG
jgi:hypothetical protein